MLYNIENLLEDLNLTNKEKEDIIKELHDEFPQDEMLFEIHLFRLVKYLKKKRNRID
jgi:hypothetical protein